jgi:L-threonylcarbamoyladenylate synthase
MSTSASLASVSIGEAADRLRAGGLAAFPTDTVYGVGALASNAEAVEGLFRAKRRRADKAIPILLASADQLDQVAGDIPEAARRLAGEFWPGPLTLVLRRGEQFRSAALAGGESVAVRVPDHPMVRELIERVGEPLAGTSANLSGEPSPVTAEEVRQHLGEAVDVIVDGGRCPGEVPSTVVDVTVDPPRVLREGPISRDDLERVLGVRPA